MTHGEVGVDIETKSIEDQTPLGIGFALSVNEAFYFPFDSPVLPWHILTNPNITKVFHNGHFDLGVLKRSFGIIATPVVDTIIAAHLLGKPPRLLDLAALMLDQQWEASHLIDIRDLIGKAGKSQLTMDQVPQEQVAKKCCLDAEATIGLWQILKQEIPKAAFDLEMKCLPLFMEIEGRGMRIDQDRLAEHIKKVTVSVNFYRGLAEGQGFNPGSSKQVAAILEGRGHYVKYKRQTGNPILPKEYLETYYYEDPIAHLIVQYRNNRSTLSNLEAIRDKHLDGDRIYGRIHQIGADTGRPSTSKPNRQNIPEELRDIFIASEDCYYDDIDLSQIELRAVAWLSQDKAMLRAFEVGEDFHAETSQLMFGNQLPANRRRAKETNFSVLYLGTEMTMFLRNQIPLELGREFIAKHRAAFPRLYEWMQETIAFCRKNGYTETWLGRRRSFPDINSSQSWKREADERACVNLPVQGTASEILKELQIRLREEPQCNMVHDELLNDVPFGHKLKLEGITDGLAPFPTPAKRKVGLNWRDLVEIGGIS